MIKQGDCPNGGTEDMFSSVPTVYHSLSQFQYYM